MMQLASETFVDPATNTVREKVAVTVLNSFSIANVAATGKCFQDTTTGGRAQFQSTFCEHHLLLFEAANVSRSALINGALSHFLITRFLKEELTFNRIVIFDWETLKQSTDATASWTQSHLRSTCLWCPPTHLIELVNDGRVARIDDAVRLGLWNSTSSDYPNDLEQQSCESITLLKNQGDILPLKQGITVLVSGPNVNSMCAVNNGWTYNWQGDAA
jgi:beta-glucosidase